MTVPPNQRSRLLRGSRRHILDLVSTGTASETLTGLIAGVGGRVDPSHRIRPVSHVEPGEWDLRRFCRECAPQGADLARLDEWWVSEQYTGPTWDLLAECTLNGRPGILMVEAKAHESELQLHGKLQSADASEQSNANHARISESLARTQAWFRRAVDTESNISAASHYQLANRLSGVEALASCGVPAILMYLGFRGDTYFKSDYFRDDDHWQQVMLGYIAGVVPAGWIGQTTAHERGGSVTMLIRSLPILQVSTRAPTESNPR